MSNLEIFALWERFKIGQIELSQVRDLNKFNKYHINNVKQLIYDLYLVGL